jgi:hypothetical protein
MRHSWSVMLACHLRNRAMSCRQSAKGVLSTLHIEISCFKHQHVVARLYDYNEIMCMCCRNALAAYQEALAYAPNNSIAMQRMDYCKTRVERLGL